jgi:ADP-heptose:LPS heptosyltransferase
MSYDASSANYQDGRTAIISDKQLGDITLLEPLTRLIAEKTGHPCALYVKEGFRPLVDLMSQAVWGPDTQGAYTISWTTSWSSRAAFMTKRVTSKHKNLLINQPRHLRWWQRLFFHQIISVATNSEYWGSYFWRALGGAPDQFISSKLNLPPEEWRHPSLPKSPYILINPTAAWPSKFWLPEAWGQVMRELESMSHLPWVMTGGGSDIEKAHCSSITTSAPETLVNLAGKTSLKEYIHSLSRAKLVICVDGSASHIAQALNVPVITIFGPVFPVRWHWPTPRHRVVSAFQNSTSSSPTSADVTASAVIQEIRSLVDAEPDLLCSGTNPPTKVAET